MTYGILRSGWSLFRAEQLEKSGLSMLTLVCSHDLSGEKSTTFHKGKIEAF